MTQAWEEDGDPWTVKSATIAFANDWFWVEANKVIHPDGADGEYAVVRVRRLAVGVLAIEPDGRVHLVGQWRFPLARYSWEMPEGGGEPGERASQCAHRELAEETGLRAGSLQPILELDMSNSLTDERGIVFLATELVAGEAHPEPTEVLRRRAAPFGEVLARVVDGRIRDSLTVVAVLRAHHMAVTGALPAALARAMLAGAEAGEEDHG